MQRADWFDASSRRYWCFATTTFEAGQVGDQRRAGQRRERGRRRRHPQVLADLGEEGELRLLDVAKQQIRAERRLLAAEHHVVRGSRCRRE
jgi:hypothetical protein